MTHYMNNKMERLDIPSIPEFIEMIADSGAGLYACKASVDLFGLEKNDFIPQVNDIITVGDEKIARAMVLLLEWGKLLVEGAGAVGMAVAYELVVRERSEIPPRVAGLRDRLRDAVLVVPGVELSGHPRRRLPGHLSVIARDIEGEAAVVALDLEGIYASVGSACTTGSLEPSHVLTAMGYPDDEARGSLRLTLGRTTTDEEIERAVRIVPATIARLRASSSVLAADPLGEGVTALGEGVSA